MHFVLALIIVFLLFVIVLMLKNRFQAGPQCPYCQSNNTKFLKSNDKEPKRRHVANYRVKHTYLCDNCQKTFDKTKISTLYHGAEG